MMQREEREGRHAGILMLAAIALGMTAANSPLAYLYQDIHHYPIRADFAGLAVDAPLIDWINQGLLLVFFFHIGIHTKREMTSGVLASAGRAALPAFAALGGMVAPASIYILVNAGDAEALRGWAIPIATDIVLVVGLLSFLGRAVSPGLLAFVTAVAIFDDLGAVLVIAVFYGEIQIGLPLAALAAGVGLLGTLNRLRCPQVGLYLLAGALLWGGLIGSGLEGAVSGAVTGLALPLSKLPRRLTARTERRVAPLALFVVVPVFAFFNSGVSVGSAPADWYTEGVALGIVIALMIGKPIGILVATLLAIRGALGRLPEQTTVRDVAGAALFAGVGFTMSLFVASAAFDNANQADLARLAILVGSSLSAVLGGLVVMRNMSHFRA